MNWIAFRELKLEPIINSPFDQVSAEYFSNYSFNQDFIEWIHIMNHPEMQLKTVDVGIK